LQMDYDMNKKFNNYIDPPYNKETVVKTVSL